MAATTKNKKILKFLPKTKSFSIPKTNKKILTIVPENFKEEDDEPKSPKVSCMGQVGDHKKRNKVTKRSSSLVSRMFVCRKVESSDADDQELEKEEVVVVVEEVDVDLEPKKEINIWMRRSITPPIPLQLK